VRVGVRAVAPLELHLMPWTGRLPLVGDRVRVGQRREHLLVCEKRRGISDGAAESATMRDRGLVQEAM
jgi:hypothetical protein